MNPSDQEEFILNCAYNCNGQSSSCRYYKSELLIFQKKDYICSVKRTINNDLQKIKEGKTNITYSALEKKILSNPDTPSFPVEISNE